MDMTSEETLNPEIGRKRREWTALELQAAFFEDVFRYFVRRVRPIEEAEDLTSATFLAAFANLGKLGSGNARPILYGIARRKLADALRKRRVGPRELDSIEPSQPAAVEQSELTHTLKVALAQLPPAQGEALLLRYLEDLDLREIAVTMHRSEKSVKGLLQRAREQLRSNPLLKAIAEEIHV